MPGRYSVSTTPSFERDARRLVRRSRALLERLREVQDILSRDPHNRRGRHNIRKLTDVKPGDGQWRIRVGDYRIRYDIVDRDVVLHSFRHRRDVY